MIAARFFPATGAAKAVPARIAVSETEGCLLVHLDGELAPLRVKLADINVSERFSRATRGVYLPDGAMLEVDDPAALSQLLGNSDKRDGWVTRLQHSWRAVAISFVASVVIAVAGYIWGLPIAADYLAHRVPVSWTEALDRAVLAQLTRMADLKASDLPQADQARLRAKFDAVVASAATREFANARGTPPKPTIYFHKMGSVPNAFALPGGSIVFFDGLVKLAPDDDAVVGVFAHEYGHVIHRHGLRNLLRTAVISGVAAWYFGDFTALANAAILVSQLSYSRDFEREADDAAVEIMRANGLNTKSLAALFRKMRDFERPSAKSDDVKSNADGAKEEKKSKSRMSIPEFLSTHPDIDERIERFEKM
jgi:Zn-dependent protease with chaperone function